MRKVFFFCLVCLLLGSCTKEGGAEVEIYLLKSFTLTTNQSTNPVTLSLSNPVLSDAPLVADDDIAWYKKEAATFKIKKNLKPIIQSYGQKRPLR